VRKKEKYRSIDTLRRKLIKIGIYSAPIVASISIPDIKIQAETPVEEPPEDEDPGGYVPAPTFRKKNIIEEEKNKDKDRKNKKKRLSLMDDLDERGNYIFESPFRKPRSKLRKKQEEDEE
jgi:hypothetical protein